MSPCRPPLSSGGKWTITSFSRHEIADRMSSRTGYVLLGACGGVFFGIFAVMDPSIAEFGLWTFAITGSAGAVLGLALHATQTWELHGPTGNLLRWVGGLGLAGIVLGLVAMAAGAIPLASVPGTVGCGLLAGWVFGLIGQQRSIFGGDGYRVRTAREIAALWTVILRTLAIACVLVVLSSVLTA